MINEDDNSIEEILNSIKKFVLMEESNPSAGASIDDKDSSEPRYHKRPMDDAEARANVVTLSPIVESSIKRGIDDGDVIDMPNFIRNATRHNAPAFVEAEGEGAGASRSDADEMHLNPGLLDPKHLESMLLSETLHPTVENKFYEHSVPGRAPIFEHEHSVPGRATISEHEHSVPGRVPLSEHDNSVPGRSVLEAAPISPKTNVTYFDIARASSKKNATSFDANSTSSKNEATPFDASLTSPPNNNTAELYVNTVADVEAHDAGKDSSKKDTQSILKNFANAVHELSRTRETLPKVGGLDQVVVDAIKASVDQWVKDNIKGIVEDLVKEELRNITSAILPSSPKDNK
ncbi:MAG: DUF2497 domain-containing protein [Holosporales bacterium]|nr:DUF2497 domain-containing protein [Holosporales bacterium]